MYGYRARMRVREALRQRVDLGDRPANHGREFYSKNFTAQHRTGIPHFPKRFEDRDHSYREFKNNSRRLWREDAPPKARLRAEHSENWRRNVGRDERRFPFIPDFLQSEINTDYDNQKLNHDSRKTDYDTRKIDYDLRKNYYDSKETEYDNKNTYYDNRRHFEREIDQLQKASGPDGILNEMIKHTSSKLQLAVLKLFNVILRVGYFPDIWNQGLITPIFKNGDKFDPNNYRGICVSSNLGKLFCSIINARLLDFITTHNVLSRSQIGFLPNYRTSDHIYTLHTLIEKHVHQDKGKIYACFIDFKKAFDSIWHQGLFYKLIESGIGGKTYDLIKSMYTK